MVWCDPLAKHASQDRSPQKSMERGKSPHFQETSDENYQEIKRKRYIEVHRSSWLIWSVWAIPPWSRELGNSLEISYSYTSKTNRLKGVTPKGSREAVASQRKRKCCSKEHRFFLIESHGVSTGLWNTTTVVRVSSFHIVQTRLHLIRWSSVDETGKEFNCKSHVALKKETSISC